MARALQAPSSSSRALQGHQVEATWVIPLSRPLNSGLEAYSLSIQTSRSYRELSPKPRTLVAGHGLKAFGPISTPCTTPQGLISGPKRALWKLLDPRKRRQTWVEELLPLSLKVLLKPFQERIRQHRSRTQDAIQVIPLALSVTSPPKRSAFAFRTLSPLSSKAIKGRHVQCLGLARGREELRQDASLLCQPRVFSFAASFGLIPKALGLISP